MALDNVILGATILIGLVVLTWPRIQFDWYRNRENDLF